ncbi:DUF2004 domain-containing protein [Rhodococcus maanshanensis]|uniref:DUF2004 domain-containing protein n=1 Tax=Rhodococcus maanshanensis TaxID=183556 RepID=UPI0022B3AED8|nr:DUF2004 domain-containing protein [Rhodococcus maanshanensis]MCZ4556091.1 DUF2004 domain-containing protein [Rhodococcus maanshanensis]
MQVTIHSELVGPLTLDTGSGFADDITIRTPNGVVPVWLSIFESAAQNSELLGETGGLIDAFPELVSKARKLLVEDLGTGMQVAQFVEFHTDELDLPEVRKAYEEYRGQRATAEGLVALLDPKAFVLNVGEGGGLESWIDFTLSPDASDQLLVVRFDSDRHATSISWES